MRINCCVTVYGGWGVRWRFQSFPTKSATVNPALAMSARSQGAQMREQHRRAEAKELEPSDGNFDLPRRNCQWEAFLGANRQAFADGVGDVGLSFRF